MTRKLLRAIVNCDQIVQVCSDRSQFRAGLDQDRVDLIERRQNDGVGCSIVFDQNGLIVALGHDDEVRGKIEDNCWNNMEQIIDGKGCALIPGLVDAHTHPVWAGDRVGEFDLKLRGASYLEIHNRGGGIQFTVEKTANASEDLLVDLFLERIQKMTSCGTTVLECKTGYGLEYETELKMLKVIQRARSQSPIELVTTFLGAHSVPKGMTPEEGVENVVDMMNRISKLNEKFEIEFVDVFCEDKVFDVEQSRRILDHGRKVFQGSDVAFHGDELCDLGSGAMGAQIGARSISHLEFTNQRSIQEMAAAKVAAVLCPTTCYLLRLQKPPARSMIASNVPVVIATDYNPNAMCYSMPMAMNLAAVHYGLTLNECLVGATLNAAYALKRSETHGSLEIGKRGDCVLLNAPDWRHLIYQFGDTAPLIKCVLKNGQIVSS